MKNHRLGRWVLFCPKLIPITGHPSPSLRLGASPSCCFSLSPLPSGFFPPASFSYSFTRPVRSIIGKCLLATPRNQKPREF